MATASIYMPVNKGQTKTPPQVLITPQPIYSRNAGPLSQNALPIAWYAKVRTMRKDPTISMVRQLVVAPALSASWNYLPQKGAPEEAAEFIKAQLDEMRAYIIRTTFFGCMDFGYQAYEKIFDVDEESGKIVLKKLKALLPDWLEILVNVKTGSYAGLRDWHPYQGWYVQLLPNKTFLHAFDVEGTYWYGKGYMENAEKPHDQWSITNGANERYDTKIAGSHWVIHYPMGVSVVGGVQTPNETIAQTILNSLQSSGGIAVPKKVEEFITDLDKETPNSWEIELISDTGATQVGFLERMNYLDRLKVRAFGFPERSILEGKYGTKAEAETHADFAVSNILLRADDLVRDINWYLVDPLLEVNFGPKAKGTVRIESDAIGADVKKFMRDVYMKLISDPKGFTAEMAKIDRKALRSSLYIPYDADDEEETELFQDDLERLEEGPDDSLLDPSGLGTGIRPLQPGEVGRPKQQRSGGGDNGPDSMGDISSRRKDQRSASGQPVRGSSDDDLADDS